MKLVSLASFIILLYVSCNRGKDISYLPPAEGICNKDAENKYHYALPAEFNEGLPLLIILDSGGDGLMAVNKTAPALSKIPCVIIGSDLIRNNFPDFENAIGILIEDAIQKFGISTEQVIIAGFSGGARMAFEYARLHPVKAVLLCGAGSAMNSGEKLPCPVYMIAGTSDFNFHETYYNPLVLSGRQGYFADYFSGSHEWPPAETLKDAYLFLMGKSIPGGEYILKQESDLLSEKADSLMLHDGSIFFTLKAVEKAIILNPGNKKAKKQFQKIKRNTEYTAEISRIESDLYQESRIDQAYFQAAMVRDSVWWTKELHQLSLAIASQKGEQKDHYLRIKGFLGILFYSQLNALIHTQPGNPQIVNLLAAYRMAEPDNPDVYYDFALYEWKMGKEQESRKDLTKALSLGFRDQTKLLDDFPAGFLGDLQNKGN